MIYLVEKGRIAQNALHDLQAATSDPKAVLQYVPLDANIAMKMMDVSRREVPDPPDRIIAVTASFYGVPLLTRDERIESLNLQTIW
jgi:PIN domain nuclease of toxin-antitoxin system